METAPLMTWRDAWAAHHFYEPGDVVMLAGVPYVCTAPLRSTVSPDGDSDHWALLLGGG